MLTIINIFVIIWINKYLQKGRGAEIISMLVEKGVLRVERGDRRSVHHCQVVYAGPSENICRTVTYVESYRNFELLRLR